MRKEFAISEKSYRDALKRSSASPNDPWRLRTVAYDKRSGSIVMSLSIGVSFLVPAEQIAELSGASISGLSKIYLTPSGETLVVESVDAHISAKGLISDVLSRFPVEFFTSRFAAIGGARTSSQKKLSSVENGKKGGRPKKTIKAHEPVSA
jgi:hypothetical protein